MRDPALPPSRPARTAATSRQLCCQLKEGTHPAEQSNKPKKPQAESSAGSSPRVAALCSPRSSSASDGDTRRQVRGREGDDPQEQSGILVAVRAQLKNTKMNACFGHP